MSAMNTTTEKFDLLSNDELKRLFVLLKGVFLERPQPRLWRSSAVALYVQ